MSQAINNFLSLKILGRMKTVIASVVVAAVLQFEICQPTFSEYSGKVDLVLTIIGMFGCILLGFNAPNKKMAYWGSVALGVPSISYSMVGYGLLEMGGFLHALGFGLLGVIFYGTIQSLKARKQKPTPTICNSGS